MTSRGTAVAASRPLAGVLRSFAHRLSGDANLLPVEGQLPPLEGATGWLNSQPLTPDDLRGRVVLIDFWTYTCINWIRTLPYLRAWDRKYRDQGLTVVGVHTPEFGFEHDVENVISAARDLNVGHPIALDNEYSVWRAFDNHFWPAVYIADEQGRVRYHHYGEGEYAMAEMVIQQLLIEAGTHAVEPDLVSVDPQGVELAADWSNLRSPETYLGSERISGLTTPDGARFGEPHLYPSPTGLGVNQWAPAGTWTIWRHAAALNEPDGRIAFRFHARDVNLVMGPELPGSSVTFRVFLDGTAPKDERGLDVDEQGSGLVTEQRLYQLIRQTGPIEDRLFEIEFGEAGVEAYSFTFG